MVIQLQKPTTDGNKSPSRYSAQLLVHDSEKSVVRKKYVSWFTHIYVVLIVLPLGAIIAFNIEYFK